MKYIETTLKKLNCRQNGRGSSALRRTGAHEWRMQQDQLVVDLVFDAVEAAEGGVGVVVRQGKMQRKNGFQLQNSVDSSPWR